MSDRAVFRRAGSPVRFPSTRGFAPVALAAAVCFAAPAFAKPQAEGGNLGFGARELARAQQAAATESAGSGLRAALAKESTMARRAVLDAGERVRVKVTLDGRAPLAALRAQFQREGGRVLAEAAGWRRGAFEAFVPASRLEALAALPGVKAVRLSPAPWRDVGVTTSQAAEVMRTTQANALGFDGTGITVGVISDSYNTSTSPIKAANDIASGDLPGPGNPLGNTQASVILEDFPGGIDEGRAMMQLVHDLAPKAKLCFATAFNGEIGFANNILALADDAGPCKADVVVDDIIYLAEPMFSDGIIAQAADQVAAAGVSYFSSAGNRASTQGYQESFAFVPDATARAGRNSVDLTLIPAADSAGGFHDFDVVGRRVDIAQTVTFQATGTLIFQWNDPFDAGGITTDYDLYVYNERGTRIVASSTDDNFATDQPIEGVELPAGTYQIVVVRANPSATAPTARVFRYVVFGSALQRGEYLSFTTPITYGHNSAAGAMGTAAIPWFAPHVSESFTSPGPATMYFDAEGGRLASPEVRQKPDVAAIDGTNTTFFISDTPEDLDTFPNFFGTSAAAPHAAAVAALMLQKASGPGSLSPAQVRSILQDTGAAQPLEEHTAVATATGGAATVSVRAFANGDTFSQFTTSAYEVSLSAPQGWTLENVTIDVSTANPRRVYQGNPRPGLHFDPRADVGFPFTLGRLNRISAADITASPLAVAAPFSQQLTVSFAPGSFGRRSVVRFGVDRDESATGGGGGSMELMEGGTISGTVRGPSGPVAFSGTFQVPRTKGYSELTGYGLIDAIRALDATP
jgi:hypothetical protein